MDPAFLERYRGSLVSDSDVREIETELGRGPGRSYVDFVDRVKYCPARPPVHASSASTSRCPSYRMPLETLQGESKTGVLHRVVSACHTDLATITSVYRLFGREITHRKTLMPSVPHGPGHLGSKRAVRGVLSFQGDHLKEIEVHYLPSPLYPNEIDHSDLASVKAEARFHVPSERMVDYDFRETPASPQFAIYMVASPEDGAIWHGVGKYAAMQLVQSYTNFHRAVAAGDSVPGDPSPAPTRPPAVGHRGGEDALATRSSGNIDEA